MTSGTYGSVFGVLLAQKRAGQPFTVVGKGSQWRDFTFVNDVCDAFVKTARAPGGGEITNMGSGHTHTINYLVQLLGGDVPSIPKRPGEPDTTFADVRKIARVLNRRAQVPLGCGVAAMLERLDDWRDAPGWDPASIRGKTAQWFKHLRRCVGPAPTSLAQVGETNQ